MKKFASTILIMFLLISSGLSAVSGETDTNDTMILSTEKESELKIKSEEERTGELVSASEDGHYNISFDDGYNGYCINYGDHEASEGHNFTVQDTTEAINHKSQQSVGNELKTFFVEYYDIAMKDIIKTQHIIWHFSDDFTSWRVDPDLIDEIRNVASQKEIPDHGAVRQINNTTEAVFDFEVLQSHNPGHQNFFAYKITYRDILKIIENETFLGNSNSTIMKNESAENSTGPENETNLNTAQKNETTENMTISQNSTKNPVPITKNIAEETKQIMEPKENDPEKHSLMKHKTGYNYLPAILILLFGTILIIKYSRD